MYQYDKEVGQSKSGDVRFVEKCRDRDQAWRKSRDKGFLHRQRRRKVRKLLERDLALCPSRVRSGEHFERDEIIVEATHEVRKNRQARPHHHLSQHL